MSSKPVIHLERSSGGVPGTFVGVTWCGVSMSEVVGMANWYAYATCRECRRLALAEANASVREYRRQRSLRRNGC